jgi:subtilisin-like proprotein convertase family protein
VSSPSAAPSRSSRYPRLRTDPHAVPFRAVRRAPLALACSFALGAYAVAAMPGSAGAVVGGEPADVGEWPWHAVLTVFGDAYCGGSILELDVVVTAAHCTEGLDAGDIEVEAGSVEVGGDDAQRRSVDRIVAHEGYDAGSLENDIALLFLSDPFDPSDAVAPVALPDPAAEDDRTDGGDPAFVTGFGVTSENASDTSDILIEGEIEIFDDATCVEDYEGGPDDVSPDLMLCAGLEQGGVDACFGDSGGPLVVPADADRSSWFLVGIVSWGDGCGRRNLPTVYTEVTAHLGWLAENGASTVDGERFESGAGARIPAFGSIGKAGPYPLTVDVAGFDGTVASVAVELVGLRHERAADLDIWLEAPDGTFVTLLSDVGGDEPLDSSTVLVDASGPRAGEAPFGLRASPSDRQADRQRKGAPPPADLAVLAGTDADGEWKLLVADDRRGGAGSLDSWTLILQ